MAKIRVRVEKGETKAATPLERQHGSQQDAAVASEHEREGAVFDQRADTVSQMAGICSNRVGVAVPSSWRPIRLVTRRRDDTCFARLQTCLQALIAQRPRHFVAAWRNTWRGRPQPEI